MNPSTRILIIEDNQDDEVLLLRQLRKAELSAQVKVIADGERALKYLVDPRQQCEKLVAIFLDLKLPKIGGIKILETIRADERLRHLRVILMTSSNALEDIARCRELGVSCYVTKPVTFTSFAKAVADSFQVRRSKTDPVPSTEVALA